MPSETSSAPREVWTVNFRDSGQLAGEFPIGDQQSAADCAVDGSAFFGVECVAVEYVRRDLVPTVDEIERAILIGRYGDCPELWEGAIDQAGQDAISIHALLLSRIEGDGAACSEGDNDA